MQPETCSDAAADYTLSATDVQGVTASEPSNNWRSSGSAKVPVAVATDGTVYVAFAQDGQENTSVVVATASGPVATIDDADIGGLTATADGFAVLYFDPDPDTDERRWVAVSRFSSGGQDDFSTELFNSPNLDDEGAKGEPGSSRFGYLPEADLLVAYFGHTQRYDDGVRHQGGYLATVDAQGTQDVLSGWFGSHNLDQRLLTNDSTGAVLGLGDAYPEGIFFSFLDDPEATVIYSLAAAGNGAVNGQLGGMVDLGGQIIVPFITNRSLSQDLDAGTWPDINDAIADQIRDAENNGTDLGLLSVPNTGINPDDELEATWVATDLASEASLTNLKSARYGTGEVLLLIWAETSGSSRDYYTMVVDPRGAICQAKTPLDEDLAPSDGDDVVVAPDGRIVWAVIDDGGVRIVALTPGS